MGGLIKRTLARLGYAEPVTIKLSEAAEDITRKSQKKLTKQRLAAILKADHVSAETLEWLARGLGISVAELMSGSPRRKPK